jgi:hypothetical protein
MVINEVMGVGVGVVQKNQYVLGFSIVKRDKYHRLE